MGRNDQMQRDKKRVAKSCQKLDIFFTKKQKNDGKQIMHFKPTSLRCPL